MVSCASSKAEYEAFEMSCASLIAFRSPLMAPQSRSTARLRLLDYMIKPIQRICRYPLMLRALLASLDQGSRSYAAAAAALSRMRDVADSVDAARQHGETEARTLLVAPVDIAGAGDSPHASGHGSISATLTVPAGAYQARVARARGVTIPFQLPSERWPRHRHATC